MPGPPCAIEPPADFTPMTSPVYYSAYRGPVWDSNGQFHHFARQCDPTHTKNGYWRFCTHADDQRAYEYGLTTPEAVLIAQDVCDGVYDGIMLRWVPGELDADNKPTVGTAAAHLETIYNERRVLGKPLSFRGRVPLYPISTDQRLINFRLMRYGIQKGVISEEAPAASTQPALSNAEASLRVSRADLSSSKHAAAVSASTATRAQVGTSPSSGLQVKHLQHTDNAHPTPHTAGSCTQSASPHIDSPNDEATASSTTRSARSSTICKPLFSRSKSPVPARSPMGSAKTSQTTPQCNMADYASTHCAGSSTLTSPQAGTKPTSLPRSITTPVSLTTNSAYSSPPGLERRSVPPNSTGGTLLAQDLEAPPLDPRLRGRTRLRLSNTLTQSNAHKSYELSVSTESGAGELILTEDDETRIIMHDSNGSADQSNDDLITLQCMDLTPSQLYDAQSATLPCMSCEMIGSHQPQCWIQGMTNMQRCRHATDLTM